MPVVSSVSMMKTPAPNCSVSGFHVPLKMKLNPECLNAGRGLPDQAHHKRHDDRGEDQDAAPTQCGVADALSGVSVAGRSAVRGAVVAQGRRARHRGPLLLARRPPHRWSSAGYHTALVPPTDQFVNIAAPVAVCRPSSVEWARFTATVGNGA